MLEVQKYLKEHGLEKLKEEFHIIVTEYEDRVVLNYNQIESPRFVTLVDECRGLILRKNTWEVMARSFDRFYNVGEGCDPKDGLDVQRVANSQIGNDCHLLRKFKIENAIFQDKLDGSLLSLYFDGKEWCVSTRKLAFAEGQTNLGRTFKDVFMEAASKTEVFGFLNNSHPEWGMENFTYVFELTGPENRVVTPYSDNAITLIGGRCNSEEHNYRELSATELDNLADVLKVARPKQYKVSSFEELLALVKSFPTMQEGIVLLIEVPDGSHWRIKCKNPSYLAVAHLRGNGAVSPKNVLALIMSGEDKEYLSYFSSDTPYFSFVEGIYSEIKHNISSIYKEHMGIASQKEFALTIIPKTFYSFENGIIFSLRKSGGTVEEHLNKIGAKKISDAINLKQKFIDKFHVVVEEENDK